MTKTIKFVKFSETNNFHRYTPVGRGEKNRMPDGDIVPDYYLKIPDSGMAVMPKSFTMTIVTD